MIDFGWSSARKRHMRANEVVPFHEAQEFNPHIAESERQKDAPRAFFLHGSDEAFDDGNAPMHADGSKPRRDAMERTPFAEVVAELRALIGDRVLGGFTYAFDGTIKCVADLFGGGFFGEDRKADGKT